MKRIIGAVLSAIMIFGAALFVAPVGGTAFAATEGIYTFEAANGGATITGCDSSVRGEIVIPSILGGYPVTGIGAGAFRNCFRLTSVIIPDSVVSLGDRAFKSCSILNSVTLGSGLSEIGAYAFFGCGRLTSLILPDSVTSIGDFAFYKCGGLTCVTIPDGVLSIGVFAFYGCDSLISIEVGEGNQYLSGEGGVLFNKDKTDLILYPPGKAGAYAVPDSVSEIGDYAFYGCKNLTSVTIPDSVLGMGERAFHHCHGLTSVIIGSGVSRIGDYAFYYCNNLTSVVIGSGVSSIGDYAFFGCGGLISIGVGGGNPYFASEGGVLFNKDKTALIAYPSGRAGAYAIPSGVMSIGNSAFNNCHGLTSVVIPDSVIGIGDSAFWHCSALASAEIGGGVAEIGDYAFLYCGDLTISGYRGSYAEGYAFSNNISFSVLESGPVSAAFGEIKYQNGIFSAAASFDFVLQDCFVFLAIYDGNKLAGLSKAFAPKDCERADFEIIKALQNKIYTVKLMFFDTSGNIIPLSRALTARLNLS